MEKKIGGLNSNYIFMFWLSFKNLESNVGRKFFFVQNYIFKMVPKKHFSTDYFDVSILYFLVFTFWGKLSSKKFDF